MKKKRGERSDGRIQVTYTDDGRRVSFYGRTRAEADAKRAEYIREKQSGLSHASSMTTAEWIDSWVAAYKINQAAYATYLSLMRVDLGEIPLRQVREIDLIATLSRYEGMSVSSATKYRMLIKNCFHAAMRNRLIPFDPAEGLRLPDGVTAGTHRALEPWEVSLILNNWQVHYAGLWALVMLLCGLRRGEMVALDWDCVDLANRRLTVKRAAQLSGGKTIVSERTKTKAGMRTIPICGALFDALRATHVEDRVGPVCRSSKGRRITQSAIKRGWSSFCGALERVANGLSPSTQGRRKSDLPIRFSCLPHDLRHTYATALYDAGVDIKSAMYYLGHDDLTMTQALYTHLSEQRKDAARSSLVSYLDAWIEPRRGQKRGQRDQPDRGESHNTVWRSLVACLNGVQEAGSSNLLTQTSEKDRGIKP